MKSVRSLGLAMGVVLTLSALSGCGGAVRYALLGTREYPTTEGEARLEARDEGGYDVTIEVDNLPGLDRLGTGLTTYVLWLTPTDAPAPVRAGVLELDATTRTGRAHATTTAASLAVRVTGEVDANVTTPSEAVVVDSLLQAAD